MLSSFKQLIHPHVKHIAENNTNHYPFSLDPKSVYFTLPLASKTGNFRTSVIGFTSNVETKMFSSLCSPAKIVV